MSFDYLKPTEAEIRRLAELETDPAEAPGFEPICRGPLVAALILAMVGIAGILHFVSRTFRLLFSRPSRAGRSA